MGVPNEMHVRHGGLGSQILALCRSLCDQLCSGNQCSRFSLTAFALAGRAQECHPRWDMRGRILRNAVVSRQSSTRKDTPGRQVGPSPGPEAASAAKYRTAGSRQTSGVSGWWRRARSRPRRGGDGSWRTPARCARSRRPWRTRTPRARRYRWRSRSTSRGR